MTPPAPIRAWENEGGATIRADAGTPAAPETLDRTEQNRLDRAHDSDARGEHRYPDAHQTDAERLSRRTRDDLRHRLGGRTSRGRAEL
jgi:hypothetical protein